MDHWTNSGDFLLDIHRNNKRDVLVLSIEEGVRSSAHIIIHLNRSCINHQLKVHTQAVQAHIGTQPLRMSHQAITVVCSESILYHNIDVMNNHAITNKGDNSNLRRTPQLKTMIVTILSLLLLSSPIQAQRNDDDLCSCSPREYYFKLDLSAVCPDLPPPFPPNDVFGGGVKDYTCTIGPEPVPAEKDNIENDRTRSAVPFSEDVRKLQQDDFIIPEIIDPEPVVIDSIQFFEVDTEFNVINQDPSYVRDVEFKNGDMFNYTSISDMFTTSGKENYSVPGGINMVLRGYNAEGERVRNVFTITFTNECGVPTFEAGDAIGWVVFVS